RTQGRGPPIVCERSWKRLGGTKTPGKARVHAARSRACRSTRRSARGGSGTVLADLVFLPKHRIEIVQILEVLETIFLGLEAKPLLDQGLDNSADIRGRVHAPVPKDLESQDAIVLESVLANLVGDHLGLDVPSAAGLDGVQQCLVDEGECAVVVAVLIGHLEEDVRRDDFGLVLLVLLWLDVLLLRHKTQATRECLLRGEDSPPAAERGTNATAGRRGLGDFIGPLTRSPYPVFETKRNHRSRMMMAL